MKGKVIAYSSVVSAGVIEDKKGNYYRFPLKNWESPHQPPVKNQNVEFQDNEGQASSVKDDSLL